MSLTSSEKNLSPTATWQVGEWLERGDSETTFNRDGRKLGVRIFVGWNWKVGVGAKGRYM
jgi:hypothetical protein